MQPTMWSNAEFKRRLAFTVCALVIYRLGCFIPLPGIDPLVLSDVFKTQQGGLADALDMFAGGALRRMTLFALSVGPYLSASFIILLVTSFSARLRNLVNGERLIHITRLLAIIFAALEAYGLAKGLESSSRGGPFASLVTAPGPLFRLSIVVTLTCGMAFLVWLAEQITKRGICNGISLILFAAILTRLLPGFADLLELGRTGALSVSVIEMFLAGAVLLVAFVVLMEGAQRRIAVGYAPRQLGSAIFGGGRSNLRFKLNNAGIIAPIAASSLVLLPVSIAAAFSATAFSGRGSLLAEVIGWLAPGSPTHIIAYATATVVVCFLYTALLLSPRAISRRIADCGGAIADLEPAPETANHLDGVLTRITVLGALYVAAICVLPEVLIATYSVPIYFGGTSLLVVVCVALDAIAEVRVFAAPSGLS